MLIGQEKRHSGVKTNQFKTDLKRATHVCSQMVSFTLRRLQVWNSKMRETMSQARKHDRRDYGQYGYIKIYYFVHVLI